MPFPLLATPSRPGAPGHRFVTAGTLAAVLAAGVCLPAPARADFDRTLAQKAGPVVLQYLRDNGYHTVGVLKFRVKRANGDESFYAGPLNDSMATRLENALIYNSKEDDNFVFLQNPSAEAAKQKQHLSYLTPEGREKLLALSYPLAFGDEHQMMKPDALLAGLIHLKPAEKTATLTIEAISAKSKDLAKIDSWEVPLDTKILVEAGAGFNVGRAKLQSLGADGINEAASDAVADSKKADAEMPLQVSIIYDKQAQKIAKEPNASGEFQAPEPKEKQQLAIRLKNTTKERLGVVLLVNGHNTIMRQQGLPATDYKRWILDPGDEEDYEGFYREDGKYDRFSVLSDAESKKMMETEELSACNLGTFELYVFREGKEVAATDEEKPFSLGLRAKPSQRPKSLNEARSNIKGLVNRGSLASLGVIGPDSGGQGAVKLQVVEKIKNPQLAMSMIIRYYQPKMKKISE